MAILDLTAGTDRDFLLQARAADGSLFTAGTSPFLSSDTLTATVWPGAGMAQTFAPSVAWTDATIGTFTVTVAASQTAALPWGVYRLRVTVTRSGKTGTVFDGRLKVTQSPGTATANPCFTARSDLLLYAPWLEELQADGDALSFAAEQDRATARLIDALVSKYQGGGSLSPMPGQPGWGALASLGIGNVPPSRWLREQLIPLVPNSTPPASMPMRLSTPANFLDPTVSTALLLYPEVKEICARWAIANVCLPQVGREGGRDFQALGAWNAREASALFKCHTFEIDLSNPQTGWASIPIPGGGGYLS